MRQNVQIGPLVEGATDVSYIRALAADLAPAVVRYGGAASKETAVIISEVIGELKAAENPKERIDAAAIAALEDG